MTTCPSCGLTLPASAKFCARCGHHVATDSDTAAEPATTTIPAGPATQQLPAARPANPSPGSPPPTPGWAGDPTLPPPPPLPTGPAWRHVADTPGPRRNTTAIVLAGLGAFLLLGVIAVIAFVVWVGRDTADLFNQAANGVNQATTAGQDPTTPQDYLPGDQASTPPDSSTPDTPDPLTADTTTPLQVPVDGSLCSTSGTGPYSTAATGNDHTSCPFASAVRDAYLASGADGSDISLHVHSPVTKKDYDMTCTGAGPVQCTGGNDALVLLGSP